MGGKTQKSVNGDWRVYQAAKPGAPEGKAGLGPFVPMRGPSAGLSFIPFLIRSAGQASGIWLACELPPPLWSFSSQLFHYYNAPLKGLEKYLAGLPNHAGTRILSGHLRPLLPRHARDNSYPHHAMLDKGALEVVLTPRTWLELGFRIPPPPPPTALIRISAVLLLPGIWPQTSARVQGAFSGNHTNIETFCFRLQLSLPPPGLLVWRTRILSPETGNSGSAWLTLLKLRS